jgi:hypothetical protein
MKQFTFENEKFQPDYIALKFTSLGCDPKKFVMLLPFLTYAQQLDFKIDFLGDTSYRTVPHRPFFKVSKSYFKIH